LKYVWKKYIKKENKYYWKISKVCLPNTFLKNVLRPCLPNKPQGQNIAFFFYIKIEQTEHGLKLMDSAQPHGLSFLIQSPSIKTQARNNIKKLKIKQGLFLHESHQEL